MQIRANKLILFQFTHPGKGATHSNSPLRAQIQVSIHAPWEGCDFARYLPRCEGRFQFTHPGKGATRWVRPPHYEFFQFQFTHPGKGATGGTLPRVLQGACFNSRTLGRVRPLLDPRTERVILVSIHAPWEGCDLLFLEHRALTSKFQFTHPGKGATHTPYYQLRGKP